MSELVEPRRYAGDRPVIRQAYDDGRRYGRWEADNAISWDTTCVSCAAMLDAAARAHADGEVSGVRSAMAAVEAVAARISTADSFRMAKLVREEMMRHSSHGSCDHLRTEDCLGAERPVVAQGQPCPFCGQELKLTTTHVCRP